MNRRRLTTEERQAEIVAAALRLFSARSADEVSIDEIAAEAEASRALVYHYFGSKQKLYLLALRTAADQLTRSLEVPVSDPLTQLRTAVHHYVEFAEEHAVGYLALMRGNLPSGSEGDAVNKIVEDTRRLIADLVPKAVGINEPSPMLRATLSGWVAMAETISQHWLESKDFSRDELEHLLVNHLLAALGVVGAEDPELRTALAH